MPRLRTRPTRQETAARLIEGARVVFAEKGFHGARLEDICAQAGLTRGAFYSGFASKDDLFLAMYDGMIEEVRALTADAVARMMADAEHSIEALSRHIASGYTLGRDWYLLNAEFTLYAIRNESARRELAARRRLLRTAISDAIDKALQAADRQLIVDADLFARLLVGMFDAGLGQSLVEPAELGPTMFGQTFLPGLIESFSAERSRSADTASAAAVTPQPVRSVP